MQLVLGVPLDGAEVPGVFLLGALVAPWADDGLVPTLAEAGPVWVAAHHSSSASSCSAAAW